MRIEAKDKSASNAQVAAIASAWGDKFIIHLDVEMLGSLILYYQLGLGNRLCYEITFNDYGRVIVSTKVSPAATWCPTKDFDCLI